MPIYAYKCESCGLSKDVLQKISDAPLTVCPACGQSTMRKQVTAAGFQLKGSGWYVTDFKGGAAPASAAVAPSSEASASAPAAATTGTAATPAPAAPAAAAAPASPSNTTPSSD
jgi:putative FmdB family regulatory protein